MPADLDDSNNLISLDSLLEDNSGYNNDTKSETPETRPWSTPSEYQQDVQEETPIRSESETSSMNELPLQSLASKDPDDTQGLARTTIKVLKTNMVEKPIRGSSYGDSPLDTKRQNVEVLASENSSLETTVTKRKPNIVEDPIGGSASGNSSTIIEIQKPAVVEKPHGHPSTLLKESTTKTTKNLVEGSKRKSKKGIKASPSPKSGQTLKTPFGNAGNAMMHVNLTRTKHNHMVLGHKAEKEVGTKKPKHGNIHHLDFTKNKQSNYASSKTFRLKMPIASKDEKVKNRQQTIFENQKQQNKRVSSHLKLKNSRSSEENESLKKKANSSSNNSEKKRLRKLRKRKKSSKTSEDAISNENQ